MRKDVVRQWINVLALVVTFAINSLAATLPLGGLTTGEISDLFPVYFTPADYVFRIWFLIYGALFGFIVYQALPSQRENPRLRRVGYLFVNATTVLNYLNWSGWGISPEIWTVIMLAAATIIGSLVSRTRGDAAYMLVLVWAFVGIAVKHAATPVVATAAWIAAVLVAVMMVVDMLLKRRK